MLRGMDHNAQQFAADPAKVPVVLRQRRDVPRRTPPDPKGTTRVAWACRSSRPARRSARRCCRHGVPAGAWRKVQVATVEHRTGRKAGGQLIDGAHVERRPSRPVVEPAVVGARCATLHTGIDCAGRAGINRRHVARRRVGGVDARIETNARLGRPLLCVDLAPAADVRQDSSGGREDQADCAGRSHTTSMTHIADATHRAASDRARHAFLRGGPMTRVVLLGGVLAPAADPCARSTLRAVSCPSSNAEEAPRPHPPTRASPLQREAGARSREARAPRDGRLVRSPRGPRVRIADRGPRADPAMPAVRSAAGSVVQDRGEAAQLKSVYRAPPVSPRSHDDHANRTRAPVSAARASSAMTRRSSLSSAMRPPASKVTPLMPPCADAWEGHVAAVPRRPRRALSW